MRSVSGGGWMQRVALCIGAVVLGGCASQSLDYTPGDRTVVADWDDVEVAVDYAMHPAQLGLTGLDRTDDRLTFHFVRHTDEPAELIVERVECAARDPQPLRLHAMFGRNGDPRCEAVLLAHISHRLEQLRARETAPLDKGLWWGTKER